MSKPDLSLSAQEAIRIADKYLPFAGIEKRKALAMEITDAIGKCERELGQEIMRRLTAGKDAKP